MQAMKQQCHLAMIYFSWAIYAGGLAFLAWRSSWMLGLIWLFLVPAVEWLYIRKFPSLSSALGYGNVNDQAALAVVPSPVKVTLYTALGCPFCPLIEERLEALRSRAGFTLEKIDVTLRPNLLASKGIRTVPVVEVDGRFLTGLVSTADLAAAIGHGAEALHSRAS
jgi:glutaredoxin